MCKRVTSLDQGVGDRWSFPRFLNFRNANADFYFLSFCLSKNYEFSSAFVPVRVRNSLEIGEEECVLSFPDLLLRFCKQEECCNTVLLLTKC